MTIPDLRALRACDDEGDAHVHAVIRLGAFNRADSAYPLYVSEAMSAVGRKSANPVPDRYAAGLPAADPTPCRGGRAVSRRRRNGSRQTMLAPAWIVGGTMVASRSFVHKF